MMALQKICCFCYWQKSRSLRTYFWFLYFLHKERRITVNMPSIPIATEIVIKNTVYLSSSLSLLQPSFLNIASLGIQSPLAKKDTLWKKNSRLAGILVFQRCTYVMNWRMLIAFQSFFRPTPRKMLATIVPGTTALLAL